MLAMALTSSVERLAKLPGLLLVVDMLKVRTSEDWQG